MDDGMDRVADVIIIGIICIILGLKFTGIITISWFWLLSPIIFLFGLGIILTLIMIIIYIITIFISKKENDNERY